MKLTDWFPPKVKPHRSGVYQRLYPQAFKPSIWYCYWDGKHWGIASGRDTALPPSQGNRSKKKLPWRGLVK